MSEKKPARQGSGRKAAAPSARDTVSNTMMESPLADITLVLQRRAPLPSVERLGGLLPEKRHHLSARELASRFGPAPETLAQLRTLLAGEPEVKVQFLDEVTGAVRLKGPSISLTRIHDALGKGVRGGFGLHKLPPPERVRSTALEKATTQPPERSVHPLRLVRPFTQHKDHGSWVTPYTAPQVARLYDFPALDGEGQCLGFIQLGGSYKASDMTAYFEELGLKVPRITSKGEGRPLHNAFADMEVTMDVQIAGALCPKAHLVIYNSNDVSIDGYFNALCMALADDEDRPSVLSVSWSFPEIDGMGPTAQQVELFEELLTLAVLKGITICSSTGDQGASIPIIPPNTQTDANGFSTGWLTPAASFTATSPLVLACGGTSLAKVKGNRIREEVVWNRLAERLDYAVGMQSGPYSMATGGGISRMFKRPAYQRLAQVPCAITQQWNNFHLAMPRHFEGRGTPDVAANADLNTGFSFVYKGKWSVGGGTSAAAPLWAALIILINQALSESHGREVRTGWLNPLLYRLRLSRKLNVVRPITQGNNGAYTASPNRDWNPCTGLGSPRGRSLARALGARVR